MPKAVLRNGVVYPVDPWPPEWEDGLEVWVEVAEPAQKPDDVRWFEDLEALCAENDVDDIEKVFAALAEQKRLAKAYVRALMGLDSEPVRPDHLRPG